MSKIHYEYSIVLCFLILKYYILCVQGIKLLSWIYINFLFGEWCIECTAFAESLRLLCVIEFWLISFLNFIIFITNCSTKYNCWVWFACRVLITAGKCFYIWVSTYSKILSIVRIGICLIFRHILHSH